MINSTIKRKKSKLDNNQFHKNKRKKLLIMIFSSKLRKKIEKINVNLEPLPIYPYLDPYKPYLPQHNLIAQEKNQHLHCW